LTRILLEAAVVALERVTMTSTAARDLEEPVVELAIGLEGRWSGSASQSGALSRKICRSLRSFPARSSVVAGDNYLSRLLCEPNIPRGAVISAAPDRDW
jgi:hypothetical protein